MMVGRIKILAKWKRGKYNYYESSSLFFVSLLSSILLQVLSCNIPVKACGGQYTLNQTHQHTRKQHAGYTLSATSFIHKVNCYSLAHTNTPTQRILYAKRAREENKCEESFQM